MAAFEVGAGGGSDLDEEEPVVQLTEEEKGAWRACLPVLCCAVRAVYWAASGTVACLLLDFVLWSLFARRRRKLRVAGRGLSCTCCS